MTALRTLLADAIDYAGLFPPAALAMIRAVENYDTYRSGEHAWALGRFVVPAWRLAEFDRAIAGIPARPSKPWKLSALIGPEPRDEIVAVLDFNSSHGDVAVIDTVELKAATREEVQTAAKAVPSPITTFVEIPLEPDPSDLVSTIGGSDLRAKARTGGTTVDAFPGSETLARFIGACVAAKVPFKATAGLHHPLRASYRLTYDPAGPMGMMFGFLNVFVATGVAQNGGSLADVASVLEEQSPSAFLVSDNEISWRNHRINTAEIMSLRSELAISFGSCSFTEPMEDLELLNFL